eukprot:scaffold166413_cov45-Prasinocladus_malaysianus.AAC.2
MLGLLSPVGGRNQEPELSSPPVASDALPDDDRLSGRLACLSPSSALVRCSLRRRAFWSSLKPSSPNTLSSILAVVLGPQQSSKV